MAQRSVTSFKSTKNSRYTDNTTGLVTALNSRDMFEDSADSFLNLTDGGTVTGNVGIGGAVFNSDSKLSVTLTNGYVRAANDSADSMSLQLRATAGKKAWLSFAENTISDRWLIGIENGSGTLNFSTGSVASYSTKAQITSGGAFGLGIAPTAILHLKAGTATANTAPLKLTTGTALTTPEDGAIEYHSSHLYFTIGSTRYQLDQQTTASNIASGTFSPTFTSQTNLDVTPTATAGTAKYTRVGDIVTVTMYANVDPTASGSYSFLASLPIASNFTESTDLLGLGATASADGHRCEVIADTVGDRALINGTSTGTAVQSLYITYTYKIM